MGLLRTSLRTCLQTTGPVSWWLLRPSSHSTNTALHRRYSPSLQAKVTKRELQISRSLLQFHKNQVFICFYVPARYHMAFAVYVLLHLYSARNTLSGWASQRERVKKLLWSNKAPSHMLWVVEIACSNLFVQLQPLMRVERLRGRNTEWGAEGTASVSLPGTALWDGWQPRGSWGAGLSRLPLEGTQRKLSSSQVSSLHANSASCALVHSDIGQLVNFPRRLRSKYTNVKNSSSFIVRKFAVRWLL